VDVLKEYLGNKAVFSLLFRALRAFCTILIRNVFISNAQITFQHCINVVFRIAAIQTVERKVRQISYKKAFHVLINKGLQG